MLSTHENPKSTRAKRTKRVVSNQGLQQGFYRLYQIIGDKNTPALIPVSRTSFLNGVKSGKYPQPVKLGERTTAWRVADILKLLDELGGLIWTD
jgi:prophage regulatory protein